MPSVSRKQQKKDVRMSSRQFMDFLQGFSNRGEKIQPCRVGRDSCRGVMDNGQRVFIDRSRHENFVVRKYYNILLREGYKPAVAAMKAQQAIGRPLLVKK